ncbi:hypothetical protein P175DRAFT_0443998 [Aspergillus ochraceoroseus IBT 24754]|uniref:Zn(2)-C6 fungal-type domain-containing protein n=1 Tax=Aspergillus ochraceoroseus IBT 24754 TaxID=1392256 RepID=A0A2T5LP49_9EURO|nr:uncharacterized protein P175DRAFT_0443998 [Aspergillus ochraceoroseus IBT 24754]PTU18060.1 hypothetical protein P175DRAFT_0443998 [Aspergillus ochraceoroseus IBT 24754]
MFHHVEFPAPNAGGHSLPDTTHTNGPKTRFRPRTHKACDRCRQMKIKCDGVVPCGHCTRFFYDDCAYSESRRKRRRASSPARDFHHLERRIRAVEESCQRLADASTPSTISPGTPSQSARLLPSNAPNDMVAATEPDLDTADRSIESRPNQGEARFVRSSADYGFVERLKAELGDWPGTDYKHRLKILEQPTPSLFTGPGASIGSAPLPPLTRAEQLVNLALDAHTLYQVVHRQRFNWFFRLLFSLNRQDYSEEEKRHIPLVYALMALGCLQEKRNDLTDNPESPMMMNRTKYFETCRSLVDLMGCDDLITLQTIFYLNLFLLSTARIGPCYTSLNHALTIAFRMNLHQTREGDSPCTTEVRARLFWSIKHLLTMVCAMSGLPKPIADDECDLPFPRGMDDSGPETVPVLAQPPANGPPGHLSFLKLHRILGRVVRRLYPLNGTKNTREGGARSHLVSTETIAALEAELQSWTESLPNDCRLGQQKHALYLERSKYELCMTFCHVQIFLYRPFLHYLVPKSNGHSHTGQEFQKYASACIHASRNIIRLAEDMDRNGLLFGSQWRLVHMLATSSISLLYVVLGCKTSPLAQKVLCDLNIAKGLLTRLRPYLVLAHRAHVALTVTPPCPTRRYENRAQLTYTDTNVDLFQSLSIRTGPESPSG